MFAARLWREWIRGFLNNIAALMASLPCALADFNDVPTGSMKPIILEGERMVVNTLADSLRLPFTRAHRRRWAEPRRGDSVALCAHAGGTRLVRPEGDVVKGRGSRLQVNSAPVEVRPLGKGSASSLGEVQKFPVQCGQPSDWERGGAL